jgi:hypothetical protein
MPQLSFDFFLETYALTVLLVLVMFGLGTGNWRTTMQCLGKSTKIKNLARCAHRFEGSKRMPTLLKSNRLRAARLSNDSNKHSP